MKESRDEFTEVASAKDDITYRKKNRIATCCGRKGTRRLKTTMNKREKVVKEELILNRLHLNIGA